MLLDFSWTVIVRRFDGSGDYNRSWDEYKQGFGDASGEYWLGNEYLHYLTSSRAYKLRFDLEDWDGNTRYAEYSSFVVNSEADNYRLLLGDYSGNASSSPYSDTISGFLYHNNSQFTTWDRDNDARWDTNCGYEFGGFWFVTCLRVGLTNHYRFPGVSYPNVSEWSTIRWDDWGGHAYSLKTMVMKMRPL